MKNKIIEIMREELYVSSRFVFGIEKAASRIEGLSESTSRNDMIIQYLSWWANQPIDYQTDTSTEVTISEFLKWYDNNGVPKNGPKTK